MLHTNVALDTLLIYLHEYLTLWTFPHRNLFLFLFLKIILLHYKTRHLLTYLLHFLHFVLFVWQLLLVLYLWIIKSWLVYTYVICFLLNYVRYIICLGLSLNLTIFILNQSCLQWFLFIRDKVTYLILRARNLSKVIT